jgi:hypothetical protein
VSGLRWRFFRIEDPPFFALDRSSGTGAWLLYLGWVCFGRTPRLRI